MLRVKVGSIDMHGLCGRDKHPRREDEGRTGRVDRYEVLDLNAGWPAAELVGMYTVTLDDDALDVRQVELAEYEVEAVLVERGGRAWSTPDPCGLTPCGCWDGTTKGARA